MPRLDGVEAVLDFIRGLQPKVAGQVARRVLALAVTPQPPDSEALSGYVGLRRVDVGEYRVVYRFDESIDLVEVILVGKRNDGEVYKRLRRLLGP
jgi:mRNA interferase RelE/StbE